MGVDTSQLGAPSFDQLEVVQTGTVALPSINLANPGAGTFGSAETSTTVNHNLGYIPIVLASQNTGGSGYPLPTTSYFGSADTAFWITYQLYVTSTQLTVLADVLSRGIAVQVDNSLLTVTYYLCRVRVR